MTDKRPTPGWQLAKYESLTPSQKKAIDYIAKYIGSDPQYEYKKLDLAVSEDYGKLSIVIVRGLTNDEGTYAQIFARDRWHLFIGKRGQISARIDKKRGKGTKKVTGNMALIYGRRS